MILTVGKMLLGSEARGLSPESLAFFSMSLIVAMLGRLCSTRNCCKLNGRDRAKFLDTSTVAGVKMIALEQASDVQVLAARRDDDEMEKLPDNLTKVVNYRLWRRFAATETFVQPHVPPRRSPIFVGHPLEH